MFAFSFSIFILSGISVATMLLSKTFEVKGNKKFFLLKAISKADERMRILRHEVLHFYAEGKHKLGFMMRKQLPLKAKGYGNRVLLFLKEQGEKFINKRGAHQLSRPENISEFFKSISVVEKGLGEIHETMINDLGVSVQKTEMQAIEEAKPKRKYARRKVRVVEVE